MNKLNTTLGSYLPSFFMMGVSFPFSSEDVKVPFEEKWISIFTVYSFPAEYFYLRGIK